MIRPAERPANRKKQRHETNKRGVEGNLDFSQMDQVIGAPVNHASHLSKEEFLTVVKLAPLVSVDAVLQDPEHRVVLGLRCNEPAKGFWFVPGGRVLKGETIAQGLQRVLKAELELGIPLENARFLGFFQHFYETNFAGEPAISTHYLSLGFALHLPNRDLVRGDQQHEDLKWFVMDEALADERVHPYTKELLAAASKISS